MLGGGVTNGRERSEGNPLLPEFHPCMVALTAMPNITFIKKVRPSKTLVTCQSPNFTGESLKSENSKYSGGNASIEPLERNNREIRRMSHQAIDLLLTKSILNKAIVARMEPPRKPKYIGFTKSSPNSERFNQTFVACTPIVQAKNASGIPKMTSLTILVGPRFSITESSAFMTQTSK